MTDLTPEDWAQYWNVLDAAIPDLPATPLLEDLALKEGHTLPPSIIDSILTELGSYMTRQGYFPVPQGERLFYTKPVLEWGEEPIVIQMKIPDTDQPGIRIFIRHADGQHKGIYQHVEAVLQSYGVNHPIPGKFTNIKKELDTRYFTLLYAPT